MNINIEISNFDPDPNLEAEIERVFQELGHFHDQIVGADIYLKELSVSEPEDKEVKIKIFLPGQDIFMEHRADGFISAAQQLYDKAKRTLSDRKDRDKEKHQPRPDKF